MSVRAISLLRNVGKFDNVAMPNTLRFDRVSVIYGENGRGKTTLAAILRSLASGDPIPILERQRLGSAHAPHIVANVGTGAPAIFQNGVWSKTAPEVVVFDDTFVADNVCSGIEIDTSHRRNLHELIVGAQGIALSNALQAEIEKVEAHSRTLRELAAAIPAPVRGNFDVDQFCALRRAGDVDQKIENAERRLAAATHSERVVSAPLLSPISLPRIELEPIAALLAEGLPDLDATALKRVQAHLGSLGPPGERWISEGMDLVEELNHQGSAECPFCAQELAGSSVIDHYRAYFSYAYSSLKDRLQLTGRELTRQHVAGDAIGAFERSVRETVEKLSFWREFAAVPEFHIDTAEIGRGWKAAASAVAELLFTKAGALLEAVQVPAEVRALVEAHNARSANIDSVSAELAAANPGFEIVKEQAGQANSAVLTKDLTELLANKARFDPAMAANCDAYLQEKRAKTATEQARDGARAALDAHRAAAFPAYGLAINDYLQRFNAGFRVGPVDVANNRQGSTANYSLLVEGHQVPLVAAPGQPAFNNTLSAGDRNTLALAFFFASLDADPSKANRVVVIDDPMTSLDEHRTLHTRQEMDRLAREVAQMIVLSHSKPFLCGVWDRMQQLPKVAMEVRRLGSGSTLTAWDVTADMVTEHDRRYADVRTYEQTGDPAIERRVAEALRPMIEAALRVAFAPDFPPGSMLGQFHSISVQRVGTAAQLLDAQGNQELRALMDYTNQFHHDTNNAYATVLINGAELTDFCRRTLQFIRRA